jgi:hypothetical protein
VCADAVPIKVRVAVTGAGVRLQLLGQLASRLHTGRRVWPDAATELPPRRINEQRLLKLLPGRGTYNGR